MLSDEELIPLCEGWARKFLPQSKCLGGREEAFNELKNIGYVTAKEMKSISGASTMIMWALIRATKVHTMSLEDEADDLLHTNRRDDSVDASLIDKRRFYRPPSPSALEIVCHEEERIKLLKALADLDDLPKTIIVMHYAKDMTFAEIGKEYNQPAQWAHYLFQSTLKRLKELLT